MKGIRILTFCLMATGIFVMFFADAAKHQDFNILEIRQKYDHYALCGAYMLVIGFLGAIGTVVIEARKG